MCVCRHDRYKENWFAKLSARYMHGFIIGLFSHFLFFHLANGTGGLKTKFLLNNYLARVSLIQARFVSDLIIHTHRQAISMKDSH